MRADVCMITEGSYPYVVGGVSTWVHDLISSMPDISFAVMHIGVSKDLAGEVRYKLPANVVDFRNLYLMESVPFMKMTLRPRRAAWAALEREIQEIVDGKTPSLDHLLDRFSPGRPDALTPYDIFHGKGFWDILVRLYRRHLPTFSFLDYFWTLRFIALPLFRVLYAEVPEASLYHATCTGYAGLLGAIASRRNRSPLIITEHGIYTNERMIEITQAQWIYREPQTSPVPSKQVGALQALWMQKFNILSRIAYEHADRIFTLYEGNRQLQVQGGAPMDKCFLIPNGIDIERYDELYARRLASPQGGPPFVAMVGRVAPIKDVKTFIRAARIVLDVVPEARFFVLGPPDEDVSYYEECERLVRILSLNKAFEFTGPVKMQEWYPRVKVVVLTSISEAQPFVLLEAMRAGIPVVATNVGACAELVYGTEAEGGSIGPAGIVTNVRSPKETAEAIIRILRDHELARKMAEAGRERVGRYYVRRAMLDAYHDTYLEFCGRGARASSSP